MQLEMRQGKMKMDKINNKKIRNIEYYIYLDYSERLVGYLIIQKEQIQNILPQISKLHHYKDIKNKKSYIQSARRIFQTNKIEHDSA